MDYSLKTMELSNTELSSFYKLPFEKNFFFKPHFHPRPEIMYVESGDLSIQIYPLENGQRVKKEERLKDNCYIVLDSNIPHGFFCHEETIISNLEFRVCAPQKDVFPDILQNILATSPVFSRQIEKFGYGAYQDRKSLKSNLNRFLKLMQSAESGSDTDSDNKEKQLLFKIYLQEMVAILNMNAAGMTAGGIRYIRKSNEFLRNNYMRDVSLDDVANYVGINKFYLEKLFKQHTGQTVRHTLLALRMETAKTLFSTTNLSVSEVAKKYGFNIRQQLIYNFRNFYGITPSEFLKGAKAQFLDIVPDREARSQTFDYLG